MALNCSSCNGFMDAGTGNPNHSTTECCSGFTLALDTYGEHGTCGDCRQHAQEGCTAMGQGGHPSQEGGCETGASAPKRPLRQTAIGGNMRSATGGRFRGQAGVSTTGFYEAGVQAAQAAFEAGGVNALLAFLAGFNSGQ